MRKKTALTATALTAGLGLCFAGTALATHIGGPLNHSTTGARFDGNWRWYDRGQSNGGFHFWGYIDDTNCGDGDNVYSKVKVMGYSPNSFYGKQCTYDVWQNWEVYDPAMIYTTHAEYQVCRDRSFPYSDNCSARQDFNR